jgi:hypothetical protein
MPKEEQEFRHYPGYFIHKRVIVYTTSGMMYKGTLKPVQAYNGKTLLVVSSDGTETVLNFDHVISIEEMQRS